MSVESKGISLVKQLKNVLKSQIKALKPVYISPVRRINGIKTNEKVCAMTFDDGPYNLMPSDGNREDVLTISLLKTLEKYGAKGTFDCIGDTSFNYPDDKGEEGTAMWGGIAYDHYPDYGKDNMGGIKNCPEIVERILSFGHEITNHSYAHRIFGLKSLVYNNRKYLGSIEKVEEDLRCFHNILKDEYGYEVKFSRPPHYVDRIDDKFSSYDAYELLGYQYLGAGPDGGGWLPLSSYEEEVAVMEKLIKDPLEKDTNAFCGAIIFQKDGCNMLRRTPIEDALGLQLEALKKHGYKVVTVSELLEYGQFEDLGIGDEGYDICIKLLSKGMCPAFSDNCIHLEKSVSKEELAMVMFGHEAVEKRVKDGAKKGSAYSYALDISREKSVDIEGILKESNKRIDVYMKLADY